MLVSQTNPLRVELSCLTTFPWFNKIVCLLTSCKWKISSYTACFLFIPHTRPVIIGNAIDNNITVCISCLTLYHIFCKLAYNCTWFTKLLPLIFLIFFSICYSSLNYVLNDRWSFWRSRGWSSHRQNVHLTMATFLFPCMTRYIADVLYAIHDKSLKKMRPECIESV